MQEFCKCIEKLKAIHKQKCIDNGVLKMQLKEAKEQNEELKKEITALRLIAFNGGVVNER